MEDLLLDCPFGIREGEVDPQVFGGSPIIGVGWRILAFFRDTCTRLCWVCSEMECVGSTWVKRDQFGSDGMEFDAMEGAKLCVDIK